MRTSPSVASATAPAVASVRPGWRRRWSRAKRRTRVKVERRWRAMASSGARGDASLVEPMGEPCARECGRARRGSAAALRRRRADGEAGLAAGLPGGGCDRHGHARLHVRFLGWGRATRRRVVGQARRRPSAGDGTTASAAWLWITAIGRERRTRRPPCRRRCGARRRGAWAGGGRERAHPLRLRPRRRRRGSRDGGRGPRPPIETSGGPLASGRTARSGTSPEGDGAVVRAGLSAMSTQRRSKGAAFSASAIAARCP